MFSYQLTLEVVTMKQATEACPTCLNAGSQSPGQSPESLSLRVADPDPNLPLLGMAPRAKPQTSPSRQRRS